MGFTFSDENELSFSAQKENENWPAFLSKNKNESDSSFKHSVHFALLASVSTFVK